MKVLNLYAGIGGNRKLWKNVEVTAVESEQYIVDAYKQLYPNDTVIVGDAHQYLIDHFQEYDFIWSSPPCPTHSRANMSLQGYGIYRYPDMKLYEEIIFLKHFYKGDFVIENVIGYYEPLLAPTAIVDRHYVWSNKPITNKSFDRPYNVNRATKEQLADYMGIELPANTTNQRKLLRNAASPQMGEYVFNELYKLKQDKQVNDIITLDLGLV